MKQRNQIIPSVYLILKQNDEILLQRRYNTGFQDGMYTFISGHIEKGESPRNAVCREAKEEAGIKVSPDDLTFEQVLFRKSFAIAGNGFEPSAPDRVDVFFSTTKWKGKPHITEPDRCDDLQWFHLSHLPRNIFPIVSRFLKQYSNLSLFDEAGY